MKTKALLLVALLLTFHATAQTSTFTNLVVGPNESASRKVNTGQVARVVTAKFPGGFGRLSIAVNGQAFAYSGSDLASGGTITGTAAPPTVAGPATITLATATRSAFCTIELIDPIKDLTPSTAVVIPADAGAPVKMVLESSTDSITWTEASTGTYGTATQKRFFRVRAERAP